MSTIDLSDGLVDAMRELHASHSFVDVTVVVEGEKFPVHKCILASRSAYFKYVCSSFSNSVL